MTEVKDAFGHVLKVGDYVCGSFLHGYHHRVRQIIAIGPQSAADRERLKSYGDRAETCVRVAGGWFMADKANKVLAPGHVEVPEDA